MRRYLAARLAALVPTMLGVATAVFLLLRLAPGDPVEAMLGETALAAHKEEMRHALGLDRPAGEQYVAWLAGLARGDLGASVKTRRPVADEILSRLPATVELAVAALLLAALTALPLGVLSAARRGGWLDGASLAFSTLGAAMPVFWLGPLLIIGFSIRLAWLPVSGRDDPLGIVLPALTLAAGLAAVLSRLVRSSVLETLSEEYIRTARARGVPETAVYFRHALSNALLPAVTVMGLQLGALLSGAVITETVFAWPGVGRLLVDAIEGRDYPVVQGCVLTIALGYVAVNFLTDVALAWLDPRIRLEK